MARYFATVQEILKQVGYSFDEDEEKGIIFFKVTGDNATWNVLIRLKEEQDRVMIYSYLPTKVPEERRPAVAEFLTRANYGMIIGNFEMDFDDGEVRYKTSADFEGAENIEKMIVLMLGINQKMFDRYYPGIMQVVWGKEPKEVIATIEGE